MVEISRNFMLFTSSSTATARSKFALSSTGPISVLDSVLPISAASAFSFGSCKEGWYYRCLGPDP